MQLTPYNRALHYFAIFTACATFLLIIAGALVTSNDAGLSVPDWPTSFHHSPISLSYFEIPLVGGIKFEHGHRIFAEFIGLLTIAIAVWTWRSDRRSWMKKLGIAALGTIIAQGILGGITVLNFLPPAVSTAHALVGQTFFCIAVCIAMFTGRRWVVVEETHICQNRADMGYQHAGAAGKRPSLLNLSLLSIGVLYVQLFLGGMFRHKGMGWEPHVINAALVTLILTWTCIRALTRFSGIDAVRRPAIAVLGLLIVQVALGFFAFIEKVIFGLDAVQPMPAQVLATVAHTAVGALLLAATVVLAIQAWRLVPVAQEQPVPAGSQKVVTA